MDESDYAPDFETFSESAGPNESSPATVPSFKSVPVKKKKKSKLPSNARAHVNSRNLKKLSIDSPKANDSKASVLAPELKNHFLDRIRKLEDIVHEQKNKIKQLSEENRTLALIQKRQEKALAKKEREEIQWQSIIDYLSQEIDSLRFQHQEDVSHRHKHKYFDVDPKKLSERSSPYSLPVKPLIKEKSEPNHKKEHKPKAKEHAQTLISSKETKLEDEKKDSLVDGPQVSPKKEVEDINPPVSNNLESLNQKSKVTELKETPMGVTRPRGFPTSSWYPTTTFKSNCVPHVS